MRDPETVIVVLIVIAGLLVGWWMVAGLIKDRHEWEKYAKEHHCQQIGDIDATVSTGIGADGKAVVVTTPAKKIYRCDGGETKIR